MSKQPLPATTIRFEVHPSQTGVEWHVTATFPTNQKEQIAGFKSETEALRWIGTAECLAWLKARTANEEKSAKAAFRQ